MNTVTNQKKVPKSVLIILYYWPPAGGPGVQRWLKFVKYLPEYGIKPIVYVPSNPNYPIIDESLIKEVSDDITIIKQPIREPYKFAGILSKKKSKSISKGIIPNKKSQTVLDKLLLFIRGNLFIPDARKSWVRPSVQYLSTYIKDYGIGTIITTGPPHSLHLIGLQLKKSDNIQWVADFRDPWTTIGYHKQLKLTKAAQKKHKLLEKSVLTNFPFLYRSMVLGSRPLLLSLTSVFDFLLTTIFFTVVSLSKVSKK